MLHEGNMARVYGRLVKIASISYDVAECVWFDGRGRIHVREYEIRLLTPVWVTPHSIWPDINEMPDELVNSLEMAAAARRREKHRKPRASQKIKRAVKVG